MAVSCPEVMYGAYYPYLYGRGAARSFHHAPHFQYDRFNVQSGAGNAGSEAYGSGGAGVSSGSASSGAQSPGSPPHAHLAHHASRLGLRAKEEDLSAHGRASADVHVCSWRFIGVGGRVRGGRGPRARAVRQRQLRRVHALLGRRGRRRGRALHARALARQAQGERAHGVAQPARVVLQRGGGGRGRRGRGRRLRGRGAVRVRPVAPALRRLRPRRAPPRRRVPRRRARAPQHGGRRRLPRPAAAALLAAPPVQARGLGRAARAAPRPRRLLALLLPRGARSGSAGAGHVQGPVLVLRGPPPPRRTLVRCTSSVVLTSDVRHGTDCASRPS